MAKSAVVSFCSLLLLLSLFFSANTQAEVPWQVQTADELHRLLENNQEDSDVQLPELNEPVIRAFYRERRYKPLWSAEDGQLDRAYDLLQFITDAEDEGLKPSDYLLEEIRELWAPRTLRETVYLDLLLSTALYRYSNHVYAGRFDPKTLDADWHIENKPLDVRSLFTDVARRDTIRQVLEQLPPRHSGYRLLKAELKRFRDIEQRGGWAILRSGPVLSPGMQHKQVLKLKQRMLMSGDLSDCILQDVDIFDHKLTEAVTRYQVRHGLKADGALGPQTRRSLNIPVAAKIKKIRINMERWRWLPRRLGRRYLIVHMTGFELHLMEEDASVMTMPVIIGKSYRATPTISSWLSVMEYNPYWTVPKTIAVEDMLPRLKRNPGFLEKKSIKLYRGWANAQEVDPRTVDWRKIDKDNFPYWMRQEPGPKNALGQVKFLFSNPYEIYLHGTPDKHLFYRTVRTFSSGCIRVKDPVKLAAYLLDDGSQQREEDVLANIYLGNNQKVPLPVAVPIYLIYWTAWADQDGKINFRRDVYGRDTLLNKAFDD
ncbi:MAG: L,D-transpeptidase family protein [Proteobacteria bacterium]|nr:L,D-transpeptidase family protein [Pseudomonadota bacterium]